ncbi:hypothetical protein PROFUN_13580 [Planoprotostelium fungivorum]|uniref:Aminopeptidase n=1 Tax=Planoprotostelium fungivorum TaxID=1890364 RepID=A0A2P6N3L2_9EUKA|nr:hypothetical protein PROFUN_13580 [Planoprotostelium fungivorum]
MSEKQERVLLPESVKPSQYHIHLTPDLKNFTFHGSMLIDVQVKEATDTIQLHSQEIKINSVAITAISSSEKFKATEVSYDEGEERAIIKFASAIQPGHAQIDIDYDGILNDKMKGFYRAKYTLNGEQRHMATTQFEPTGARKAFPCWDEPAVKAIFNITLTFPEHLTGLSNMDPVQESVQNGLKTVKYAPSPIMSTYLVAFVIGEFDHVEGHTKDNVRVRIYTPVGKKETGLFSLDVAIKTLEFFNEYYGIPYPLTKMDKVAVPDFSAGAMENWGLVTYRETALLIDPKLSGLTSKTRVAYVVAHELAHQWFGNLVTMEWWKELWLNEGFATFVGTQAIDHIFPEWKVWTQFISDYINTAQSLDGLESSHPIEVEVYNSAQIEEIFDAISYNKGASIGEAAFRKGLNIYLERFKYSNAVTTDLWNALSEASGYDVANFMNGYTKKTGYPLVTVESTSDPSVFKVSQQRFLASGKIIHDDLWWVSIRVRSSNNPNEILSYDFKEKEGHITFKNVEGSRWIKVNADSSGFFRVRYSSDLAAKLTGPIQNMELGPVDRIGIQGDAFALSVAGLAPLSEALNLARAYVNETEYTVWADLAGNLAKVGIVWSLEPNSQQYRRFVVNVFSSIGNKLGWDAKPEDTDLQKLLRVTALAQLGNNGDSATIEEAKRRFKELVAGRLEMPADIRALVYKLTVAHGGHEEFDQVVDIYRKTDLHEEKVRALRALGASDRHDLIARALDFIMSSEVRSQDFFVGLHPLTQTAPGRVAAWKFLQDRWVEIEKTLGDSAGLLDRTIGYATSTFASDERADEIENFFKTKSVPQAERTIRQSLEAVRANSRWLKNNREGVAKWLNDNFPNSQ